MLVLSRPLGSAVCFEITRKRVVLPGTSSISRARISRPYTRPASSEATARIPGSSAAALAASAVLDVATWSSWGKFSANQPRHWASACSWPAMVSGFLASAWANKQWETLRSTSLHIVSSVSSIRSSVALTPPSVEFSTGTTPKWAASVSVSRKTSFMLDAGTTSICCPNTL